jgi:hypothetical protein
LRFGYNEPGPPRVERTIDDARLPDGSEQHIVVTWDDAATTAKLYLNGVLVDQDTAVHFALGAIPDNNNWLGRAQWNDPMLVGSYNEFRIYNYALTQDQITASLDAGPDTVIGGQPEFKRGDSNRDSTVNIADAIYILQNLFNEGPPILCPDAADANDDEGVNIADAIYILANLFAEGPAIPDPGTDTCGPDTTPHPLGGPDLPECDYCEEACAAVPEPCL